MRVIRASVNKSYFFLFLTFWSFYQSENVPFVNSKVIACNACIYRPVVSNLNTHYSGSKSHLVDFEFQIPCTFYNPMITISIPKAFKLNNFKLLPSAKAGKFQDMENNCDAEDSLNSEIRSNQKDKDDANSQILTTFVSQLYKTKSSRLACDLTKDSENELLEILTSIGFQSWEIVSQNSSQCIDIPEYEYKGNEVLKVMGNLVNGSYILRFDLQNPIKEASGHWNLSITSTKNNLPTFPYCLAEVSQDSVSSTLGHLIGPLNITNTTFDSYYSASQRGELTFTVNKPNWNPSESLLQESSTWSLEPLRIRITFPACEDPNNCYEMKKKYSESFCQIYGHKYECYIERFKPELVLTIGLLETIVGRDFSDFFPLKIGIKQLIIPLNSNSGDKIKIEVLVGSVPSSKPGFLHLNQTTIEAITSKNQCIGEWVQFLQGSEASLSNIQNEEPNYSLVYSPISLGTYKLPKIRQIQIQVRSRITNSETYPILLKIGKISGKVHRGNYNVRIKPLVDGIQFVKHGLDKRVAYSSILVNALIYDRSRFQENLLIEFESGTNSIVLRNINSEYPLESILLVERVGFSGKSGNHKELFEPKRKEWEVEVYSSELEYHETPGYDEELITKSIIYGEVFDPRETKISEIGGPFVFLDSEGNYSMIIHFFMLGHQYNKMMTISLRIPQSITEFVSTDLKVQVFSSEYPGTTNFHFNKGPKVTKYVQGRVISLTMESSEGFREGWWGISVQITKPIAASLNEESEYVEFNVSRSVSTLESPYLTSLLFLSVHENYKGPYLRPIVNRLQYVGDKNHIFQLVSVQQSHSSFHPFPMLKDQVLRVETNSPSYLVTKLMYMERFRFLYIISVKSLNGEKIDLNTREIGNLGSSTCHIISILGNGYYKQTKCDTVVKYTRLDTKNSNSVGPEERDNSGERAATGKKDLILVRKLLIRLLNSRNQYTMNVVTLVVEDEQAEDYDNSLFEEEKTRPSERVNYNFIIKRGEGSRRLRLDPSPSYFETSYQFRKALISSHYYNLYTVPSSIQAIKVCPPEVPFLSREEVQSQPLILKYKYFREVISSYNYSVIPNIPGTCLREKLITSSSKKIPSGFGLLLTTLALVLFTV
ncbi:hypothetical protein HWI79_318 [Cryptosporidium felis]|nr:hypothetical protein HWI79_318 [Cryptosporidium felis]